MHCTFFFSCPGGGGDVPLPLRKYGKVLTYLLAFSSHTDFAWGEKPGPNNRPQPPALLSAKMQQSAFPPSGSLLRKTRANSLLFDTVVVRLFPGVTVPGPSSRQPAQIQKPRRFGADRGERNTPLGPQKTPSPGSLQYSGRFLFGLEAGLTGRTDG
jgi:hypothetical protein